MRPHRMPPPAPVLPQSALHRRPASSRWGLLAQPPTPPPPRKMHHTVRTATPAPARCTHCPVPRFIHVPRSPWLAGGRCAPRHHYSAWPLCDWHGSLALDPRSMAGETPVRKGYLYKRGGYRAGVPDFMKVRHALWRASAPCVAAACCVPLHSALQRTCGHALTALPRAGMESTVV